MLIAIKNGEPDTVPVAPDISNMIPCKLTGKSFWDIYLYQDPPLWKAYIDAVRHYGFDGWLHSCPIEFDYEIEERKKNPQWQEAVVHRTEERIFTRLHAEIDGETKWTDYCHVYYIDNPPTYSLPLKKVGLPEGNPGKWEDVIPRTKFPGGLEIYRMVYDYMGDDGVVALGVGLPGLGLEPDSIYEYYDNPGKVIKRCEDTHQWTMRRVKEYVKVKPDFILIGISGFMISNPETVFRKLALRTLKEVTAECRKAEVPTQIHCCGPEYDLVRISAEETDLSSINPLEIPPMGDCNLADLKKNFGKKISLMGNLHTTEVMLKGTPQDVERAVKKAMDDAKEGGGFILSTGDQCGRDTPDENIRTFVSAGRKYGRY